MTTPARAHPLPLLAAALLFAGFAAVAPRGVAAPGASGADSRKGERDFKGEDAVRKSAKKVGERFGDKIGPVIKFACENGLKEEAASTLEILKKAAPDYKKLDELQAKVSECGEPDAAKVEDKRKDFHGRLASVYKQHGEDLNKLALDCAKYGMYAKAFDLIAEVLDFDPDNREARRILGWVPGPDSKHKWITKFEAQIARDGGGLIDEEHKSSDKQEKTAHVLFANGDGEPEAWIPRKDLSQWQKGLRPYGGGWMPEDEEAKKRQTTDHPWICESEHFQVRTQVSRRAAYEFAWERLEDYYRAFLRHYFSFFEPTAGAKLLFDVSEKNRPKRKHVVILFKDRNDYLEHVKQEHMNDELLRRSDGFYSPGGQNCRACSHFFWSGATARTYEVLYHEVAHQLFEETKSWTESSGGSEGNNWVPEGTAMYSETWEKVDGKWIPGHKKDTDDMKLVKQLLERDAGSFSLARFIALDHDEFHRDQNQRHLNYAFAQALSYFLMEYDDGRYKEDFVAFIAAYYSGKVGPTSLYDFIQVEGEKDPSKRAAVLEKQFKEFMAEL
ncbi:MAG TPA: hypothetical protein VHF22_11580 [Planctomycetota bacterium]|nr:hypothetical protein [Planctomycetota bacterium]